jgi:hypothetical protein
VSYASICLICCSQWHFCYHSLLAILRTKIDKPKKEIGNLNGFEYRYLNGLKMPYFSTYPPLSISRGSGPKNVIYSNGLKIIFEWASLLY